MTVFTITVALAAAVSAAPLSAQVVARASTNQRVDCTYTQTTTSAGVISRRTSAPNCKDVPRVDGVWYQVGRGPDNNSIYVRRVLDPTGNLIIQRARPNAAGTLAIFGTRPARNSDKAWKKSEKAESKQMKSQLSKEAYKDWKKDEKAENKQIEAGYKTAGKEHKAVIKANKGKDK